MQRIIGDISTSWMGEGIRYELVAFVRAIDNGRMARYIEEYVSEAISSIVSDFHNGIDVIAIKN